MTSVVTLLVLFTVTQIGYTVPVGRNKDLTKKHNSQLMELNGHDQSIWELSGKYEGDIVLTVGTRNGIVNTNQRWPNNEIPYMFDEDFPDLERSKVIEAVQDFVQYTCIRPILINSSIDDYVLVTGSKNGCFSNIGKIGGPQQLNLQYGSGCYAKGTIIHEFLHALGFLHQQNASDRDDYITIVYDNILPDAIGNFEKYSSDEMNNFDTIYDYQSVMHYGAYAFTKNGGKTIITKDPNAIIGQKFGLSDLDILKLNRMYNCA